MSDHFKETETEAEKVVQLQHFLKKSTPLLHRSEHEFPGEKRQNDERERLWSQCVTFENPELWKNNATLREDLALGDFEVVNYSEAPDSLGFKLKLGEKGKEFEIEGLIAGELFEKFKSSITPQDTSNIPHETDPLQIEQTILD